jgi:purine-binding chemotaxis protein CheW
MSNPREIAVATAEAGAEVTQYVTFAIDERQFGVDIMSVAEIRQWSATTPLPHQPEWNRGVLNRRGAIVPVHDLRARLGGPLTEPTPSHVVVIASIRGQSVGILVDAVSDILTVQADDIRPLPPTVAETDEGTIGGLVESGDSTVALLDLDRLFPEAP